MKRGPARALALFLFTAASAQGSPRGDAPDEALGVEGPLSNDVYVAVAEATGTQLAAGDAALRRRAAEGQGLPAAERDRLLDLALDEWHGALRSTQANSWTWFGLGLEGPQRLAEGVRFAVERRLVDLADSERQRWAARLAPAATEALARVERAAPVSREQELLALAYGFPATRAGALGALRLGDLALEAGLRARARGWYARAELTADLAGATEVLAPALAARQARIGPAQATADEPWTSAVSCVFADSAALVPANRSGGLGSRAERSPHPGGALLSDGRFAVQTQEELRIYALAPNGDLSLSVRAPLADLLEERVPDLAFDAPRQAPGWPLRPAVAEEHLALVVGRSQEGEPNILLTLEVEPARPHAELGLEIGERASGVGTAWALLGADLLRAGETQTVPALAALGDFEFQPGPAAAGDWIVVQAREYAGRVRAWLFAFDRRDGRLGWQLELGSGAERVVTQRFAVGSARAAAQPLLGFTLDGEERVFAGTHLGFGVLADALTGEPLWGLKNRRRAENDPGWSGDRPLLGVGAGPAALLWGPADSDRLYALRPFPLGSARREEDAVFLAPPTRLDEATQLLGGDAEELVVLGRTGRERTLSAWRSGRDRIDGLDLGADERFGGGGLVGDRRVWLVTDRSLYLFDRTRELYLLDSAALPYAGEGPTGGELHARGAHLLVLGRSAVWSFLAR